VDLVVYGGFCFSIWDKEEKFMVRHVIMDTVYGYECVKMMDTAYGYECVKL